MQIELTGFSYIPFYFFKHRQTVAVVTAKYTKLNSVGNTSYIVVFSNSLLHHYKLCFRQRGVITKIFKKKKLVNYLSRIQ